MEPNDKHPAFIAVYLRENPPQISKSMPYQECASFQSYQELEKHIKEQMLGWGENLNASSI